MPRRDRFQRRLRLGTGGDGHRAARLQRAAGRALQGTGYLAPQLHRWRRQRRIELQRRLQQCAGVGVQGVCEQRGGRTLLHDLAQVHDGQPVGHGSNCEEVVADQQDRHRPVGADPADQVQHPGPGVGIERGRGLVQDEQLGVPHQRPGDRGPLEGLVGRLRHPAQQIRRGEADRCSRVPDPPRQFVAEAHAGRLHRVGDRLPDAELAVERLSRLLEDHAHRRGGIVPLQFPAVRCQQAHEAAADGALPRPALADESQHLAGADLQRDPGHRHQVAAPLEAEDLSQAAGPADHARSTAAAHQTLAPSSTVAAHQTLALASMAAPVSLAGPEKNVAGSVCSTTVPDFNTVIVEA